MLHAHPTPCHPAYSHSFTIGNLTLIAFPLKRNTKIAFWLKKIKIKKNKKLKKKKKNTTTLISIALLERKEFRIEDDIISVTK